MNRRRFLEPVLHRVATVGPLLFFAVASVTGFLRADYDPIAQPISALALGPQGWIQEINFALLAASFLSFAAVLRMRLSPGPASVAAPAVFVLMSAGVSLAGIFAMDAGGVPATLAGRIHGVAGFLVFPWIPVVLLVVARRFHRDLRWRGHYVYTLVTGLFCLATLVFFLAFVGTPDQPPRIASELRGLVQRVLLLPFLTWIAVVAYRAHRAATDHSEPSHASDGIEALSP